MKLDRKTLLMLIVAMPIYAAQDFESTVEGRVRYIDSAPKSIVVTTKHGTEHMFHFAKRTSIHGGEIASKGPKEALHGLKAGTEVVVHFTGRGTVKTAEEIDLARRGWSEGNRSEPSSISIVSAKTVSVVTADGAEHTFRLLSRAARDSGKELDKENLDKTTRVAPVFYTKKAATRSYTFSGARLREFGWPRSTSCRRPDRVAAVSLAPGPRSLKDERRLSSSLVELRWCCCRG